MIKPARQPRQHNHTIPHVVNLENPFRNHHLKASGSEPSVATSAVLAGLDSSDEGAFMRRDSSDDGLIRTNVAQEVGTDDA